MLSLMQMIWDGQLDEENCSHHSRIVRNGSYRQRPLVCSSAYLWSRFGYLAVFRVVLWYFRFQRRIASIVGFEKDLGRGERKEDRQM